MFDKAIKLDHKSAILYNLKGEIKFQIIRKVTLMFIKILGSLKRV